MRFRFALALSVVVAANAFAVVPQFWRVRSAEDFLAGDISGFAVTSRGELRPGLSVKKLASFTDPFVLSQAAAPNGDLYFGTGNDGKIYRLRGTELKVVYTAPEPEIYALAFRDDALLVGSSPNGKIYRVAAADGKATTLFDPKQAYIWSIAPASDGSLLVGTGVEGKLFRVAANGEGKVLFDANDTHIRSIALKSDGSMFVGTSGKGRIYDVRADGSAHALYDSSLNEISSIFVDSAGTGWAAGVSNVLPSSAPPPKTQQPKPASGQQTSGTTASANEPKKEEAAPTANVEVGFSFDDSSSSALQAGSGELYRINADGFVEVVRKFEREMIYSINSGSNGAILLSTGPQGRLYQYRNSEVSLLATVPEKQIVSIASRSGATTITTTNSGAVYQVQDSVPAKAEFRSAAKDVERFSRFGHYRIEGTNVAGGHVAIAFRSGNTRTPDATWSPWGATTAAPEGSVDAPPGRYVQWRLTLPAPAADVAVDNVVVSFMNRNMAPVIDGVAVQDPAVVFITGSYPPSPQVVEATNPDEYGIFTSLESSRDRNDPGKKVFRKGFRTITWRAHDDNGDALRYTVSFRKKGTTNWLRLRENVEETSLNFDTSQLPDGTYEVRLSVTDSVDNPDTPLTDVKEGIEFQVDNTSPSIAIATEGDEVVIRVTDRMSAVGKVEYSADAQKWIRMTPGDGIADSPSETYRIKKSAAAGKFVIVRATDAFFNVATESITLP
jgi:WD40 repeat protein